MYEKYKAILTKNVYESNMHTKENVLTKAREQRAKRRNDLWLSFWE